MKLLGVSEMRTVEYAYPYDFIDMEYPRSMGWHGLRLVYQ